MVELQKSTVATPGPVVLFGIGASQGVAGGPARIVHCRDELARLRAEEVLVVDALPTKWLVDLPRGRAVVAQTGGLLQFSARWLRERQVPAVFGVGGALGQIREGDDIEVDGFLGIVRVRSRGS
jgi:pyruvate,water dikinase